MEINTEAHYIEFGIRRLREYKASGWLNAKGEEIKHRGFWEQIAGILEGQVSVTALYTPVNEYSAWMSAETERKERGK